MMSQLRSPTSKCSLHYKAFQLSDRRTRSDTWPTGLDFTVYLLTWALLMIPIPFSEGLLPHSLHPLRPTHLRCPDFECFWQNYNSTVKSLERAASCDWNVAGLATDSAHMCHVQLLIVEPSKVVWLPCRLSVAKELEGQFLRFKKKKKSLKQEQTFLWRWNRKLVSESRPVFI